MKIDFENDLLLKSDLIVEKKNCLFFDLESQNKNPFIFNKASANKVWGNEKYYILRNKFKKIRSSPGFKILDFKPGPTSQKITKFNTIYDDPQSDIKYTIDYKFFVTLLNIFQYQSIYNFLNFDTVFQANSLNFSTGLDNIRSDSYLEIFCYFILALLNN